MNVAEIKQEIIERSDFQDALFKKWQNSSSAKEVAESLGHSRWWVWSRLKDYPGYKQQAFDRMLKVNKQYWFKPTVKV